MVTESYPLSHMTLWLCSLAMSCENLKHNISFSARPIVPKPGMAVTDSEGAPPRKTYNHSIKWSHDELKTKLKIALLLIKIRTATFSKAQFFGIFNPKIKNTFFRIIIGSILLWRVGYVFTKKFFAFLMFGLFSTTEITEYI